MKLPGALVGALLLALPLPARADRPVYLEVEVRDRAALTALARLADVDSYRPDRGTARVFVRPEQVAELERLGYRVERLADPGLNPETGPDLALGAPLGLWDSYPSWSGYVAMMQGSAAAHPGIARLVGLGATTNTVRPHALWAMKLSDRPDAEEDEPEVFLSSTMHGDETVGFVLLLRLIDELLSHYAPGSSDPYEQRITRLVDELEIWILPLANPDGTYFQSDAGVSGAIRYFTTPAGGNSWVDPNRNFPDPEDGAHPDGMPYWAETQRMMAFAAGRSISLSLNFHGGAEVVNLPWDTWSHVHADTDWFLDWASAWAASAQVAGAAAGLGPSYMDDDFDGDGILGVTNGYAWYEIDGGRQDYTLWEHRGREATLEVSRFKNPAGSMLPQYWDANREALLDFLELALRGVRGLVTDVFGTPLAAEVAVPARDLDRSETWTDPDVGDYHRLLLPATYDLRFSAAGFEPLDRPGIEVGPGDASRLDVVLLRPGETPPLFADNFETGSTARWAATVS